MKQVILIGTSHIAKESIDNVRKVIVEEKPDIVAVELDSMRLEGMMSEEKPKFSLYSIKIVGVKGFLFAVIGSWLSKKLGRLVGVDPGEDMLSAVNAARENKIRVALIDQNINVTLAKFSRHFSWKERWHLVADMIKGVVMPKQQMKKMGLENIDLTKVPSEELIEKVLEGTKERYPNLYRVLVHERNVYMVKKIIQMMALENINKIVVVVGAGHRKGMTRLIEDQPSANFEIKTM
jgi:pheromone shutdown-related protein TraB